MAVVNLFNYSSLIQHYSTDEHLFKSTLVPIAIGILKHSPPGAEDGGLMIKNYFKTAWRNLGKSKMYSFINIAGLSIGMTVAILIGMWLHDELSFDKNFKNYDRIAQVIQNVTNNGEVQTWTSVPYPLAEELRKNYGGDFKHIVMAADAGDRILSFQEKKLKENGIFFEKEVPQILSLKMVDGSGSFNDPASILLSASAA